YPGTGGQQPGDRAGRDRLPRSGLSDDPDRLACGEDQRHVLDDGTPPPADLKLDPQLAEFQQAGGGGRTHDRAAGCGPTHCMPRDRAASRSPRTLKATTVNTMATPAARDSYGYPLSSAESPSDTIRPHSAVGGWTPSPMNEIAARSSSAYPNVMVAWAMIS